MKRILSCILVMVLLLSFAGCGGSKCTSIVLSTSEVSLSQPGQTKGLTVTKDPADAADKVSFKSSDSSVARVDEYGLITAVGEGSATITVTCGNAVAFCEVVVGSGTGIFCKWCEAGFMECSTCHGEGVRKSPNPSPTQSTKKVKCSTCRDSGECPYCGGIDMCPNENCFNGVEKCGDCYGTGECGYCNGLGYSIVGDRDCSSCTDGDCRKCGGKGEWQCRTCGGTGECNYCDYGFCPTCGG